MRSPIQSQRNSNTITVAYCCSQRSLLELQRKTFHRTPKNFLASCHTVSILDTLSMDLQEYPEYIAMSSMTREKAKSSLYKKQDFTDLSWVSNVFAGDRIKMELKVDSNAAKVSFYKNGQHCVTLGFNDKNFFVENDLFPTVSICTGTVLSIKAIEMTEGRLYPNLEVQPVVHVGHHDPLQKFKDYPSLLVKQKAKGACLEVCCGIEIENEYAIHNPHGGKDKILTAVEESDCCSRQCCGPRRKFEMSIVDNGKQEYVRYERPFHFRQGGLFCCCCDCGFQFVRVFSGKNTSHPDKLIGYVREKYSFFLPVFGIYNANDEEVFRIVGSCCSICTYSLKIYDTHREKNEDHEVGVITKQWAGFGKELFTDYDNFAIEFPHNASAEERAILLGALFLIDFLFFERKKGDN